MCSTALILTLLLAQAGGPAGPSADASQTKGQTGKAQKPATEATGKPAATGKGTGGAEATGTEATGTKAGAKPLEGWKALRAAIKTRLSENRKELEKKLAPFLGDLRLDYSENRERLDKRITELSQLDPDIGGLLLDYIAPARPSSRTQRIAENSERALEQMDLTPYRERLRGLLAHDSLTVQLRALKLLCVDAAKRRDRGLPGDDGLAKVLDKYLHEAPEIELPRVIACVGAYRAPSMTDKLVPYLASPNLNQKLAAIAALRKLGTETAIAPVYKAVEGMTERQALGDLLALLQTVSDNAPDTRPSPAFVGALTHLLLRADELSHPQTLQAVKMAGRLEKDQRNPRLDKALTDLLNHTWTAVTFASANVLAGLGDTSGREAVVERLSDFVKEHKKVPYAYSRRAKAYEAFGRTRDAIRDLEKAVRLSGRGRVDPALYLDLARLEARLGHGIKVLRYLRDGNPTPEELARFRERTPEVESLIEKSPQLRRMFEDQ